MKKWNFLPTPYVWYDAPGFQPLGERLPTKKEIAETHTAFFPSFPSYERGDVESASSDESATDSSASNFEGEKSPEFYHGFGSKQKLKHPLTNAQDAKIVALVKKGLTQKEIADQLDCDPSTVGRHKKRLGLVNTQRGKLTNAQKIQVQELKENGNSHREIAQQMNCSETVISKCLKNAGVLPKRKAPIVFSEDQKNRIQLLAKEKVTQEEIAKEMNCNRRNVGSYLKKVGLTNLKTKEHVLLAENQKNQIVELASSGHTNEEIAKEMNCHLTTVIKYKKAAGLTKGALPLTKEKKDQMQALIEEGLTQKEIAEQVGCNLWTVYRHSKNKASK